MVVLVIVVYFSTQCVSGVQFVHVLKPSEELDQTIGFSVEKLLMSIGLCIII